MRPPPKPIMPASSRNILRMSLRLAPMTFMTEISRVRSYTDMIIVLAMPMAATKSEMPPMPPKTASIMPMVFCISLTMSFKE